VVSTTDPYGCILRFYLIYGRRGWKEFDKFEISLVMGVYMDKVMSVTGCGSRRAVGHQGSHTSYII
jgi:hypothetical protein